MSFTCDLNLDFVCSRSYSILCLPLHLCLFSMDLFQWCCRFAIRFLVLLYNVFSTSLWRKHFNHDVMFYLFQGSYSEYQDNAVLRPSIQVTQDHVGALFRVSDNIIIDFWFWLGLLVTMKTTVRGLPIPEKVFMFRVDRVKRLLLLYKMIKKFSKHFKF